MDNPPANAGDMGLIPDPGRFHMLRRKQARAPQLESSLHPPELGKAGVQLWRVSAAKDKERRKYYFKKFV